MKRYLAIIVAVLLVLSLSTSAFAVYDPATDGVSEWDGEVTTITVTDRLPGIQLDNNPILKELEKPPHKELLQCNYNLIYLRWVKIVMKLLLILLMERMA